MVQNTGKRGRGRPRAYDPATALARARDAFWETGYSATSLDDLAAAMGMNRPSLYAAFGDKRALYLTTLRQQAEGMVAATRLALGVEGDLRSVLTNFYLRAVGIYVGDAENARGCFLVGTALTEATTDAEVRAVLRDAFHGLDALFEARLTQAAAEGDLPPGSDVKALTWIASAALNGLAVRSRAGESPETLEGWARAAARAICGPPKA